MGEVVVASLSLGRENEARKDLKLACNSKELQRQEFEPFVGYVYYKWQ